MSIHFEFIGNILMNLPSLYLCFDEYLLIFLLYVKAVPTNFLGAKRNGTRPNHFCLGSASVARKALQSLEAMKLVQKDSNGGRSITPQGQKDMDRIAGQVVC